MKRVRSWDFLLPLFFVLEVGITGCATRPHVQVREVVPTELPRPLQRMWVGERAKVVIFEFANTLALESGGKRRIVDSAIGNNLKKHLVMGLQQTEQFTVLDPLGAKQTLAEQDFTPTGEIKQKTLSKLGSLEGAEFLIAGAMTAYQPSQMSLNAGIEADPLFNGGAARRGAAAAVLGKAFESLPIASQDRIVVDVRVIAAATGKTIRSTLVEAVPQEFGQPREGLFDEKLTATSNTLSTPMQKALRACTIKIIDWIAETSLAYRRQEVLPSTAFPATGEKLKPIKRPVVEKKNTREKLVREPTARKQEVSEQPMVGKPSVEKPPVEKSAGEKPRVEKSVLKKEVPRSEEWGQ